MASRSFVRRQEFCTVEREKVRYRSQQEAAMVSRLAQLERGVRLYIYGECQWCHGWHLTSKPNDES